MVDPENIALKDLWRLFRCYWDLCQNLILKIPEIKKNAQKTKILKNSNNFAVMVILGDFWEFEVPVPEPPYPYHHF